MRLLIFKKHLYKDLTQQKEYITDKQSPLKAPPPGGVGEASLKVMKKEYINPEIKTIELLSNTMMIAISEGYATQDDALSTGRRNDRTDEWADPWS